METSLYTALPALAALWGRATLDNLHDRVGEEEQLRGRTGDGEWLNGAWARGIYWDGHRDGGALGIYSKEGPGFDYELYALQIGTDVWRRETDKGNRDHAGIYFAAGDARGDVEHFNGVRAGLAVVDAISLGGYWTHFNKEGAYLDAVVQHTWYDAEARSPRLPILKGDATGWALSGEIGWPFLIDQKWVVEPQAQLTWQTFSASRTQDAAAIVDFADTDSLIGRLGLRGARTWVRDTHQGPLQSTGWLRVNVLHEFMDDPTTTFSSEDGPVSFTADLGSWWLQANAGLTHQMAPNAFLLVNGGYQWNLDNDAHAWTFKFGARFNW